MEQSQDSINFSQIGKNIKDEIEIPMSPQTNPAPHQAGRISIQSHFLPYQLLLQ